MPALAAAMWQIRKPTMVRVRTGSWQAEADRIAGVVKCEDFAVRLAAPVMVLSR